MKTSVCRPLALAALTFAGAASAFPLPSTFSVPPGFELDEGHSRALDFGHEPMGYFKPGAKDMTHGEPEGQLWQLFLKVTPPNKNGEATDAAMRAALQKQGWEPWTKSGTLIAHRESNGHEQWFKGSAEAADYRATIIEAGPPPHAITLPPPAAEPEKIADTEDFPYLGHFPGSTLKRTEVRPGGAFNVTKRGEGHEQLAGPPTVAKTYELPKSTSTYEYMVVYRDALTKAGWDVIFTFASSDGAVTAHYAKNGRDIYAGLHDGLFQVADVGAANQAKKLAEALARDGHVAIYGIYFDIDKSTLRPDSETALQHILELLKGDPKLKVEVQGHTDNTGTPAHNQPLSEERAASVVKWLVDHGIAAARMTPKGYGDTQPVGDNKTPEGRSKNRRVELKK